jgi:hypothetical protein
MKTLALLAPPSLLLYGAYQIGLLPLKTSDSTASLALEEDLKASNKTVFKFSKRPMSWAECNPSLSPLSRYLLEDSEFLKIALVKLRMSLIQ